MKLIHLYTTIVPIFGVLDENDNVINNISINTEGKDDLTIRILDTQSFEKVLNSVLNIREQLKKKMEEEPDAFNSISAGNSDSK